MDRYAVMGNPVSHSKSPLIHSAFAKQCNQSLSYEAIHVEAEGFASAVSSFFKQGGSGLNITLPFKQEAWAQADDRSADAELAGAVNTLWQDSQGRLQGHNTDGIGLLRDIKINHTGSLKNKKVLLLGAGGAARGIIAPLLREEPAELCIANRTYTKAAWLATLFASYGNVSACELEALKGKQVDWVINASSASLQGELPPLPNDLLKAGAACYDLMYGDGETVFCQWSRQAGAEKIMDGLGMLVEQAAESFFLWRGIRPQTASVIKSLRQVGQRLPIL